MNRSWKERFAPSTQVLNTLPDILEGPSRQELFAQMPWDVSNLLAKVTIQSQNFSSGKNFDVHTLLIIELINFLFHLFLL